MTRFQVLEFNTDSSISTHLNSFKHNKWLNSSTLSIDIPQNLTTTPSQSGHESDGNKRVLHIPQISWTGASSSYAVVITRALADVIANRDVICVFSSPSQQSYTRFDFAELISMK